MKARRPIGVAVSLSLVGALGGSGAAGGTAQPATASALLDAVRQGDRPAMHRLVQQGVDVNTPDVTGATPLHWAVHRNDVESVDLLLRAGAHVQPANELGVRPLTLACENGNAAIIARLVQAGADPNTVAYGGETALMTAARTGVVSGLEILIAHGADVNAQEPTRGQTALMWAAAAGNADAIRRLVTAGAEVNRRTRAPEREVQDLRAPDHPNYRRYRARQTDTFTPLMFAVRQGHLPAVEALLDGGADVNQTTDEGIAALLVATANAHWDVAALLVDRGADPNASAYGWNALHQLIRIRSILDDEIFPPPPQTARLSSLDVAKTLIAAGVDVNARMTMNYFEDPYSYRFPYASATPFLMAAASVDHEMMRLLVAAGADPKATITAQPKTTSGSIKVGVGAGTTALMWAAGLHIPYVGEAGNGAVPDVLEAVKLAIELGNEVNAANADGETALMGAVHRGEPEIAELLIEQGAKLDAITVRGCTALSFAVPTVSCYTYQARPKTAEVLRHALRLQGLPEVLYVPPAEEKPGRDR